LNESEHFYLQQPHFPDFLLAANASTVETFAMIEMGWLTVVCNEYRFEFYIFFRFHSFSKNGIMIRKNETP
jgi:hypothetical protein